MDKNGAPNATSIELNERSNNRTPNECQIHDEMVARQVFSKRSSLDPPKHEKRHHPSRCRSLDLSRLVILLTLVCQRKLVSQSMTEPEPEPEPGLPRTGMLYYTFQLSACTPYNLFTIISPLSSVLASAFRCVRHTNRSRTPHLRAIRCKHILSLAGNILALERHHAPQRPLHISARCPVSPSARPFRKPPSPLDAVPALLR